MRHLGLLITKDDDEIIGDWFCQNSRYFDGIACLDGSRSSVTRDAARRGANIVYVHEDELGLEFRTDHGLRAPLHDLLIRHFGDNCWITLCHADEFFYHNPRLCCQRAEQEGSTGIFWYAVHFLPHLNDRAQWPVIRHLPIPLRFRYYHWDVAGSGAPWLEFRSYRNGPPVRWEPVRHGNTQPLGCDRIATFHPAYRHFKVFSFDEAFYERDGSCMRFRHHWQGVVDGRTGIPWVMTSPEDLFVAEFGPYRQCDYFRGTFEHEWNIGDQYR